ncbi:carbohydrate ABC transporter permease [Paenibacillus ginsengarvi]|uniref:Carbohydrate ABC transporter permease n=1 Tax=Paenibacillus ginsengarvi TaxID=400777 RepID=A0A3B0BDD1_9BACL|nr:carbohydrate ABC transporter permease [Paenibacillus ginsengarvi]RKN70682.1 carbohydrate ABC transporter permease [Paenibacillus ginsengarvi]
MVENPSLGRKLFVTANYGLMVILAFVCLFPLIHVLALSFSSSSAAEAGRVGLLPVEFTLKAYEFVLGKDAFVRSFAISLERLAIGTVFNMVLCVLLAYPLSKEARDFKMRTVYVWFFFITAIFGGGLIPTYMTVKNTGLMDTIWALILPGAVPVFNVILVLNFFRSLPKELEEAAFIDGAGHLRTLWSVYVPLSKPVLATVLLYTMVGHWNSWFDGLIYMNDPHNYPLQSYLQTVIIQQDFSAMSDSDVELMRQLSSQTVKAAQIFLGALPIIIVYPFLQKFFVKGIVLGSVKG